MGIDNDGLAAAITLSVALVASSGFWAWVNRRGSQKNAVTQLVLGLAHDRIVFLGKKYLERGWITADEYEDLNHYLYEPYSQFGGNGLAKKVMDDVTKLPFHPVASYWPSETEKAT